MKQDKLNNLFDFLPKSKVKAGDGLDEGKYPFYTSSENQSKYLDEFQHEPGCLVFGTGGKASVHFTTSRFATSTDCITIQPKPKAKIDAGYVFQFFKGNMQVLESGFKGAGLKHISKAYLSDIQISHPEEIDDQKRIAHLIGKVERLIARRKQHLKQIYDLLKSVFLEMFGDPVRNEKGWDKNVFREVTIKFSDGPFGSNLKSSHYRSEGIRVVRLNNIGVWEFNNSDKAYVSQQHYEDVLKKYSCFSGDVLIGTMGDPNIRACLLPESIPVAINKADCVLCRINPNYLSAYYILGLLNNPRTLSLVSNLLHGQTRTRVSMGQLAKLEIPIPPIDLQNQFAAIVKKVEGIKSRYQQSLADLESLYGALSQKAFKGELDLSRVPLATKGPEIFEEEKIDVEEKQPMASLFELPAPEALAIFQTAEGRKSLLGEWLNAWLEHLGDAPFTAQAFMEAARQRLWELAEDEAPDWGAAEYDELKAWVFEALEQGRLTQGYDDANNRVQITAVKG
jgi:type I restriction enzyme S subunit